MRMYREFANWFHLLTHPDEYATEAADYTAFIRQALPDAKTLLELGSGGGNNAFHMKKHFDCTLTDLSAEMLALSRTINPELEHIQGDMRSMRLGRTFDVVFIHDAIEHMTTPEQLTAAAETAFVHTRSGGIALFLPDGTAETFMPSTDHGGHDGSDGRSLRYLEWTLPPRPGESTYEVHFAVLMKDGDRVTMERDVHHHWLFTTQQWHRILTGVGFVMRDAPALDSVAHEGQALFLCTHEPPHPEPGA